MKLLSVLALTSLLAACAGGGGGGGGSSGGGVVVTPFTNFSALQPNTTVFAPAGFATDIPYNSNTITGYVTSMGSPSISSGTPGTTSGVGATSTLNANTLETALNVFSGSGTNATWSIANGDSLTNVTIGSTTAVYGVNAARTNEVLYVYGPGMGWNYQTYGVSITGEGTGSGHAGAMSVGAISPVSGIPATGTATFTGTSGGVYVAATGQPYLTVSDMTAATNFGARSIAFNTTNTIISAFNGTGASAQSGLNLSGTLTYSAGTNTFNGSVTTANAAMTGSAFGTFYGPTATEIGGIYNVKASTGLQSMGGAFGGKR